MAAPEPDSAGAQAPSSEASSQAAFPTLPLKVQAHHWEGENDSTAGGPARGTGDAFGTACAGTAQFRPRLLPTVQQPGRIARSIIRPGALLLRRIVISGGLGGASRTAKADRTLAVMLWPQSPNPPMQTVQSLQKQVWGFSDARSRLTHLRLVQVWDRWSALGSAASRTST